MSDWMGMELSHASNCGSVVHCLWEQKILRLEDMFQVDRELHMLDTTFYFWRSTTVPQLVVDHFIASRTRISATTA
ncbi:hypothetical protein TNCV_163131 [Trichonephila clavipes]|nr:hypothetical protein TNCV_163131 [Trichonephila clavipes]